MTLSVRLKLFIGSMAAAALAVLTMAALVPWQLRVQEREAIQRRLADESKLIADLLSSAQDARRSRHGPRGGPPRGARVGPCHAHRRRRPGGRRLDAGAGRTAGAREPRHEARGGGGPGRERRHQPALQHHPEHGHGLRGHAHGSSGGEVRAAGAAAQRHQRAAGHHRQRHGAGARRRARGRARPLGALLGAAGAACGSRGRGGEAIFVRRLQPSRARLRRRRTGRRGARARRRGAGTRPAHRRPVARPRPHRSHPGRHGRGRADRRSAGQGAAREPRRPGHAARLRAGGGTALRGGDPPSRHRGAARVVAAPGTHGQSRAHAVARRVADLRGARRRSGVRQRRRRRPRAARHHRPAQGRPDPAGLRRQRVARAAHAAHRHPRLRRSAARRPARSAANRRASSKSSAATPRGWNAS